MLRMLESMFHTDRHAVIVASDAETALEEFRANPSGLVLTDLNLPGKTGEHLAQQIKKLAPETPVILMTGISTVTDYIGVDAVIRKPFTKAVIVSTINRCLNPDSVRSNGNGSGQ